jgi:pimeloyl-ACP methyl ester carboxylesterase
VGTREARVATPGALENASTAGRGDVAAYSRDGLGTPPSDVRGLHTSARLVIVSGVTAEEFTVAVGDRIVQAREAGDRNGAAVVFLHGTPSSRLDLHLAEPMAEQRGVRLVSFDRPGYGGSTPAPFSLRSVARDVGVIADRLRLERFAVFGQSAGSRFALATAAMLGERVTRIGVNAGGLRPGPRDDMDDDDRAAYALLPDDPAGAARLMAGRVDPLVRLVQNGADDDAIVSFVEPWLPPVDGELLRDPRTRAGAAANVRESLRQGPEGAGWDDVTWLAPWGVDVSDIRCPVFIWFGDQDEPLADATWLSDHVADPRVVIWPGEGHLAYKPHLPEILEALTTGGVEAVRPTSGSGAAAHTRT